MDVLTQSHLTTLRELLLYRRRELASEVHAADLSRQAMASAVASGAVGTFAEGAAHRALEEVDAAQEQRDRDELIQVDDALSRLDQGVYGDCTDCGEPVSLQRLMVQPEATRCAACQCVFEHRPDSARNSAPAG